MTQKRLGHGSGHGVLRVLSLGEKAGKIRSDAILVRQRTVNKSGGEINRRGDDDRLHHVQGSAEIK